MCWNCQKSGHFKKDCRNPKAEGNNSANVVTEDVDDVLLLANHITVDDWVLDLGASFCKSLGTSRRIVEIQR